MRKSLFILRSLLRESPKWWWRSVWGATITSLPWFLSTLLVSGFTSMAIDEALNKSWPPLAICAGILFALVLLRLPVVAGYRLNALASEKLSARLQWKLIEAWNRRDPNEKKCRKEDVLTRIVSDCAQNLSEFFFQGFGLKILEPVLTGLAALLVLARLEWRVLVVSIVLGFGLSGITTRFTKKIRTLHAALQHDNDVLNGLFLDVVRNMETVKKIDLKKDKRKGFDQRNQIIEETSNQLAWLETGLRILPMTGELFLLITTLILAWRLPSFPVGSVVLVGALQPFVNNLFANLGTMRNELEKAAVHGKRVLDTVEDLHSIAWIEDLPGEKESKIRYLELRRVGFVVGNHRILRNVNIRAKQGELIGIQAPSGSGKSTLLTLIQGLREPDEGQILFDGVSAHALPFALRRQRVRLFPQQPVLFRKTIQENVEIVANRALSNAELRQLATQVGWDDVDFGKMLEEGGSNLSGGERQKVAFMQALVCDAQVLLLDEPTSAMDSRSEAIVWEGLQKRKHEKIIVCVSHRTALLQAVDRLYGWDEKAGFFQKM